MNNSTTHRSTYPGFYQVAYVTNDIDVALGHFGQAYGVNDWFRLNDFAFPMASGKDVSIDLALAYLGDTQFELVKPVGGDDAMYRDVLSGRPGFELVFHHLCKAFDTEAQFREHHDWQKSKGVRMPMDNSDLPWNGIGFAFYSDFRDTLGHYLEYVWFGEGGADWVRQIPQNG